MSRLRVVDLFSGCGGFTLGIHAAGMNTALAVDIDPILTSSFAANFPGAQLLLEDLSAASSVSIELAAGGSLDGIVGGPPCQGFSEIGQQDVADPRRLMIDHFFRLVQELRPSFFVMENVRGLFFSKNVDVLNRSLERVAAYYHFHGPMILEACDYGAPTRRPRLFVFGFRRSSSADAFGRALEGRRVAAHTVWDAIGDLAHAQPDGLDADGFDWWRYPRGGRLGTFAASARLLPDGHRLKRFTGHRRTRHTNATMMRFAALSQGQADRVGKHIRLKWDAIAPTIRAGTGSERGSFQAVRPIHPDEPRVITPREAARIQGFPDWFAFHPTVWHSFRMIGNSVSPTVSRAVMSAVVEAMGASDLAQAAE